MITFKSVHIEGFCSIPKLELNLNTSGITVIRGANGLGKSTIFSAIVWAIYGKNLKGNSDVNTWKKYRNTEYKGTKVELYFSDQVGHTHKIIRCLDYKGEVEGAKGGNRLIYLIDADSIPEKSKPQIQAKIVQSVGMSYSLFLNSVMFGQGLKRLVNESGAEQKNIFEELLDLEYLTQAKNIAYEQYKELEREHSNTERILEKSQSQLEGISRNINSLSQLSERVSEERADQIKSLKYLISTFKERQKELKASLLEHQELEKLEEDIKETKSLISKRSTDINASKRELGIPLEDLIDEIIDLLEEKKISASLKRLKTLKEAFTLQSKLKDSLEILRKKLYKLDKEASEVRHITSQLKAVKNHLEDHNSKLEKFKNNKTKDTSSEDIAKLQKEYKEEQEKYNKLYASLKQLEERRDVYKWTYTDPLGSNGIKAYLFESSLDSLNEILSSYSDVLGFQISFNMDMQGTRKEFVTELLFEGQEVPYEDLSGGQKQLVHLAVAFAMNTILSESKGVNIAFLDEVFESLSSDNIEIVVGLIRKIYRDKTLFLITHQENLPIPNSRVLKVTRVKGLSHYEL